MKDYSAWPGKTGVRRTGQWSELTTSVCVIGVGGAGDEVSKDREDKIPV